MIHGDSPFHKLKFALTEKMRSEPGPVKNRIVRLFVEIGIFYLAANGL